MLKSTSTFSSSFHIQAAAWNRPAMPLLFALIAGILAGRHWPGQISAAAAFAGISLLLLCMRIYQRRGSTLWPLLLFFGLGYISIQTWISQVLPPDHVAGYADRNRKIYVTGTIQTEPVQKQYRTRFLLRAEHISRGDEHHTVAGRLRVTVSGAASDLQKGDRIRLRGKIRSIRNFNNPGGFDYRQHMRFQGVRARIYSRAEDVQVLQQNQHGPIGQAVEAIRTGISNQLDRTLSGEPRQVLHTLLLGNRHRISSALRESFNRAGASHILAISGLHIGIIASAAFLLLSTILSRFSALLWKARVRKAAAIAAILPVLFYGIIAGMSPSTQRAVIMVILFLLTFPLEQEHDLPNTIFLAALFILIFFPPALFSISFQLSFAAVLSIVYGLMAIRVPHRGSVSVRKVILYRVYLFFLVSILATFGTAPIVLYYFNQISLIGVFTNLIAIPAIGFTVLPLGFTAILLLPFSNGLSALCLNGCEQILAVTIQIIHGLARLPFAAIQTVTPSVLEVICFYGLFGCLLYRMNPDRPPVNSLPRPVIKFENWVFGCLFLILTFDIGYWVHTRFLHDDLRIHILDVGQGSAVALELPRGHVMLIDGGGFSDNAMFDVGAKIIAPFLRSRKINTVDTLILSHPNSDHMNGLIHIARNFHVKQFWSNHDSTATASFQKLRQTIAEKNIRHPAFDQLPKHADINGVRFDILHPPQGWTFPHHPAHDLNNNSLVVRVSYQGQSFLFPGDIMKPAEKELVRAHRDHLQSVVLTAPHHGSRTSSSPSFLNAVAPRYVIISCGWQNRFNMPHPEVLERYRNLGCKILRVDQKGCIRLTVRDTQLRITYK